MMVSEPFYMQSKMKGDRTVWSFSREKMTEDFIQLSPIKRALSTKICVLILECLYSSKLIGASYYANISDDAFDYVGHGSHTASTAAGNEVHGASFFGLANGTARGGVPSSRIAMYSVCDMFGGISSDGVLAAFDDAIADGVDIITISIGVNGALPIDEDIIAIGSFHAMEKGVLVTHSAGNSGPDMQTVSSIAPWLLTVAASTTDRRFVAKLVLGDGTELSVGNPKLFTLLPSFKDLDYYYIETVMHACLLLLKYIYMCVCVLI